MVLQAEGERIHAARVRRVVDRAFERDGAGRFAGRAHEGRCSRVDAHGVVSGADRGAGIERRHDRVRLHRVVELRGRFVDGPDVVRGRCERGVHVAMLNVRRHGDHGWREAFGGIEPAASGQRVVAWREQHGAFGGDLQRLSDHHPIGWFA